MGEKAKVEMREETIDWQVDLGSYNDTVLDNENYEVSYAVLKPEIASSW